jgi:phosphoglucosamine mutase
MARKYFGTDGVRGRVGEHPITPDFVMRLGYAAGKTLAAHDRRTEGIHPTVLVGKDTRISGYMLESVLEAGFSAAGVDVLPGRPAAHARHCLPDPRPAPAGGRRHFGVPQPV